MDRIAHGQPREESRHISATADITGRVAGRTTGRTAIGRVDGCQEAAQFRRRGSSRTRDAKQSAARGNKRRNAANRGLQSQRRREHARHALLARKDVQIGSVQVHVTGRGRAGRTAHNARRIGIAKLLVGAAAIVAFPRRLNDEVHRRTVGRLPANQPAQRPLTAILLVGAVGDIFREAVMRDVIAGNTQGQLVLDDRNVHHPVQFHRVVIAVGGIRGGAEFVQHGAVRSHVHHTAGRAASVQSGLRTAQNFEILQVVE